MKTSAEHQANRSAFVTCSFIFALLVAISILSIMVGAVRLSLSDIITAISGGKNAFIVMQYRLPRLGVSIMAGGAFGLAGAFLQGALRNPRASPDVVGITKWAGLGAFCAAMLAPAAWSVWAIPLGVVLGALLGAATLFLIARQFGGSITALVLTGVAAGMMAHALMQYMMVLFPTRADQSMIWLAGSVYGRTLNDVVILAVWLLACLPLVVLAASKLDASGFGDDTLNSIGLPPTILRGGLVLTSVLLSAGAVAAVGSMGFLGLLAPHIGRLMVGSRSRYLVPASALLGALALCLADLIGRVIALPNEIPAGIIAAVVGGPYLVFLLFKEAGRNG
jgi:iron complex transport system permease protein